MPLTVKQQRLLTAMLGHSTIKDACREARVSQATAFRWLKDPIFQAELGAARGQALQITLTALQATSATAVKTLRDVMTNPKAHPTARVSAARATLEMTLRAQQQLEIEARLVALEAAQIAQKGISDDSSSGTNRTP